tara:strand:- start:1194 stop:1877 length:684 start_codon:yes stop_codon:yes gene_type:complete
MSTKELAKLSQLHYLVDKHGKKKGAKKIEKKLEGTGYELEKLKRGVAVYRNKESGESVLGVKGTDVSNRRDILSDIRLGLGLSKHDKQFKSRTKQIKEHMKKEEPNSTILLGHSLGGSIVTSAMAKSKSVRDNVKEVHNFNSGYTKAFNSELSKGLSKDDKKVLKDKLTQHHTEGDVISTALTGRGTIGRVKKIKSDDASPLAKHSLENWTKEEGEEPHEENDIIGE